MTTTSLAPLYLPLMLCFTVLGATMTLLFVESRLSRAKTLLIMYGTTAVVLVGDVAQFFALGMDAFVRLYTLTNHAPIFVAAGLVSRHRGGRLAFQLLTVVVFCLFVQHIGGLAYMLSGGRGWVLFLAYGVAAAALIAFLMLVLRPLLFKVLDQISRGWWLTCIVIAYYYAINIYLIPGYAGESLAATVIKPALSLLMVGFYAILIILFTNARHESETRRDMQLLSFELSALGDRLDAMKEAEETVRIERHDLRHRLQTAAELVSRGDAAAALDFLNASQRTLDEQPSVVRWCRPPILDAVFSTSFDRAEREGIRVDADISLPETLRVDEAEFAVVCANALENAINACKELPPGQTRTISCKAIGRPSVMLKVSNPCTAPVRFDRNGLPVAAEQGHGTGVLSIAAFAKKHGATTRFFVEDGWFTFMIVL